MASYYSLWYILVFLSSQYVSGIDLSSLTFVIDDTSSMSDDIASVKRGVTGIFDTVMSSKESQIENFVLVTFNDHSSSSKCTDPGILRVKTKNETEFKAALEKVTVDGGAIDCEECAMEGIRLGLEESLRRSSVYVFTDATAKDYERFEEVKRLALEKQCQIVFVLTGLCSEPTTNPKYKVYEAAAKATGGQIFHIEKNKNEVDKVLEYVKMTLKGRMYPVNSTTLPPGTNEITINADALMGQVLFSIASDVRNDPSVTIKGPDGSDVWKKIIFSTEKNKVYAFNATNPGTHTIQVHSTAEARAVVSANSGVDFEHGFSSIKLDSLLDSSAMPEPDAKTHLVIKLNKGDIVLKSVKLLRIDDSEILDLPLEIINNATKFYTTQEFDPPSVPFKIAIIGYHAASDSNIIRTTPTAFERKKTLPGETINNKRPSVVIDGESKVNANYNKQLNLTCKVEGYPEPNIVWKNLGKGTVFSSKTLPGKIYPYDHLNVLSIGKVTENATYSCEANNPSGSDYKTVAVEVIGVPATINPPKQLNKTLIVDQKLSTLSCRATGVPEPEIKWTYQSFDAIEPTREIIEYKGETLLKLKNIQLTHEGRYTCIASNFAGSSDITYNVNVYEEPRIDRSIETEVSVIRGHSAIFECKILYGKPKPSITWYFRLREGYKDSPENFNEVPEWKDKETVELKRAYKRNSGTYQCQAKNDISTDYLNINLTVEYRPTILNKRRRKEFIKAKVGVEVSIPCYVDGSPPPSVTWFKDNVELVDDGEPYTFGPYNLKFVPQLSHKGYYTCNATNKLGTDSKTVKVDVTVPATILIPRITSYSIPVGSDLTLPCKSRGDPKPNIKWTYRRFGDRKPSKEKINRYALDNSLDLKHIQVSEEGYYTCIAINTGGSMNVTYEIQVFAPVAIVNTYKQKRFIVVEGDIALQINCNATGNPKPTITWTKDGSNLTLGSTYFVEEGTLYIADVPIEASGFYTCEVQNPRSIDQETYEVIVQKYPPFVPAANIVSIKEGQSEEIKCPLPHTYTDQLRWFKNGVLIHSGKLLLMDASVSQSGFYSCRVSTLTKSYSRGVEVFVGYGPKFKTIENENVKLVEGWPVSLNCESDSRPEGHVTWYHDGKKMKFTGAIYYFPAGISSPGQYSCEVKNTYGHIFRTFHVTQEYCVIKPSILVKMNKLVPLMTSANNTWLETEKSHDGMVFPKGSQINFYCQNGFNEFPDKKYITAFCDSGPNFLIDGEKYDYSDIKCTDEDKHIIQRTGIQCMPGYAGENTEKVNIGYKTLDYAEVVVYEVCINKMSETPIYAKNIMRSSLADDEFETTWYDNDQFEINFEQAYKCRNQIEFISDALERWFHNKDECCFSKRQLVSPRDVFPGVPQRSTYSYYNVVPHWSTCNVQNWNNIEQRVRNFAKKFDSELLVWTGTAQELSLPKYSSGPINIHISDLSSKQQTVPLFLWKVIQNPVSMSSLAIIQVNVPDLTFADVSKYILCKDQCDRIDWIKSSDWHDVRKGYIYCCRLEDFESAFGFRGVFEPDMNFLPIFAPY